MQVVLETDAQEPAQVWNWQHYLQRMHHQGPVSYHRTETPKARNLAMRYQQQHDGDTIRPVMRGYRMLCCHCGLVHRLDFFVVHWGRGHKVEFKVWRDNRATAAARRGKAIKRTEP